MLFMQIKSVTLHSILMGIRYDRHTHSNIINTENQISMFYKSTSSQNIKALIIYNTCNILTT